MKFSIDGVEHEVPSIDTIDVGESMVLYNYSGLTIDQIEDVEGLNPGLLAALMHIAIARADQSLKPKEIEAAVKGSNLLEIMKSFEEDADAPPPSAPESNGNSNGSEASSGADSHHGSESLPDAVDPSPIGTPPSATTATSLSETSAV